PYFDADQRVAIERRVLALTDETTNEEERERRTHRRNRLLSRLPSALLATDEAKQARRQLEEQSGLIENRPLVRLESGWGGYSEEQRLRDQGADPSRQENKALLEATKAVEQFSSEWRNGRPTAEAVASIIPALKAAFQAVREVVDVDEKVRAIAW